MALETFTPPVSPSVGLSEEPEIKLYKAEFGDGYTQTTAAGLNHIRSVRSVTWEVLTEDQHRSIKDFLHAHGGYRPFRYQFHGDAAPIKWTVEKWRSQWIPGGYYRLEAEFRQSFTIAS